MATGPAGSLVLKFVNPACQGIFDVDGTILAQIRPQDPLNPRF
jgi:hypothetical protein